MRRRLLAPSLRPMSRSEHPSHRPGGDVPLARTETLPGFPPRKNSLILKVCPLPPLTKCCTGHLGFLQAFANTRILFCQLACSDMLLKWYKEDVNQHWRGSCPQGHPRGTPGWPAHISQSRPCALLPQRILLEPGRKVLLHATPPPHPVLHQI